MVFCVQVTVLVEFLIDNCSEIFGEDIAWPASALTEESAEHTDSSTGKRTDWGLWQTGAAAPNSLILCGNTSVETQSVAEA